MRNTSRFFITFFVICVLLTPAITAHSAPPMQADTPTFVLSETFGLGIFTDAEMSPDGKFLAAGGSRGVWLFKTNNFNDPQAFFPVDGGVSNIAFDPTGTYLAGTALDGHIWDISSGKEVLSLYERDPHNALNIYQEKIIQDLAFSLDGQLVAIDTQAGVDVWRISDQELVYAQYDLHLVGFQEEDLLVGSYKGAGVVVSGQASITIYAINIVNWIMENSFELPTGATDFHLRQDAQYILASAESTLYIVSADTGEVIAINNHPHIYYPETAFNPVQPQLAFDTSEDHQIPGYVGEVQLWNYKTDELITISGYDTPLTSFDFSPDGTLLATGEANRFETHQSYLRIWNTASGGSVATSASLVVYATKVRFSPDGSFVYSIHSDGTLRIWNPQTADLIATIGHGAAITDLNIKSGRVVTANSSGEIAVWQIDTAANTYELVDSIQVDPISPIRSVDISSSGNLVAFTTGYIYDRENAIMDSIQVWNLETDHVETLFEDFTQQVDTIAISPNEEVLAVAELLQGQDGLFKAADSIQLWDLNNFQPLGNPLAGHTDYITALLFSDDGKFLASGGCGGRDVEGQCNTGELFIWDTPTGQPVIGPLHEHTSAVYGLAFNSTNEILASGSGGSIYYGSLEDYSIALWDTESGQAISTPLLGEFDYEASLIPGPIYALDFSPDDKLLLSGTGDSAFGYDSVIRLWDVSTKQKVQSLNAYNASITDAAFTLNGNRIVSVSVDGTVRIWEAAD